MKPGAQGRKPGTEDPTLYNVIYVKCPERAALWAGGPAAAPRWAAWVDGGGQLKDTGFVFGEMKCWKLPVVVTAQLCDGPESHRTVDFKWMTCVLRE